MRLFAAVLPPDPAVRELGAAVDQLEPLADATDLRWTERAGWHFTLAFLGEVEAYLIPGLEERLGETARDHDPFRLAVSGGGHFGDRALWAGAAGEVEALEQLAKGVRAAARAAGVAVEKEHPYVPHLTLARSPGGTALRPYADALAGFASAPWTVAELALVRSGEQPRYKTVGAWPLGRAG
ncbi:RNA 2',3'-cyclic phosphodiesterase [Streptomyces sp. NBC_01465]|uniref:RNA 2',3'-cyclic phosphodiesterase n=1 Tax=Streptomyces sp. NBC_01465 TaxID=2903878 RepID=UPI002E312EA0|nr:RNA 2',3'-cyclic phosphodiesterase [Streptomyces sp. NBC_01465]